MYIGEKAEIINFANSNHINHIKNLNKTNICMGQHIELVDNRLQDRYLVKINNKNILLNKEIAQRIIVKTTNYLLNQKYSFDELTNCLKKEDCYLIFEEEYNRFKSDFIPFSLIYCDILNFSKLAVGEERIRGNILKHISSVLKVLISRGDVLGKDDNDEFLIILRGKGSEHSLKFAEKIISTLQNTLIPPFNIPGFINVTIGITCLPPNTDEGFNLIEMTKKAANQAKLVNKNITINIKNKFYYT